MVQKKYTLKEEIANSISHGLGALLSLIGLIIYIDLVAKHGNIEDIISLTVFLNKCH